MSDILDFWCDCYRDGYRITHDKTGFTFHAVDWLRICNTKTFGLLQTAPVEPPQALADLCAEYAHLLIPLLSQPVPARLRSWWYHPLAMEQEGKPLLRMAATLGAAVWLLPCKLGVWPLIVNTAPDTGKFTLPELSPILVKNGYKYHTEAYKGF